MWQTTSLRTNRASVNLGDRTVQQKLLKPWNMEQKQRQGRHERNNYHPRKSSVFNQLIKTIIQKLLKPWNTRQRRADRMSLLKFLSGSLALLFLILAASSLSVAQEKQKAILVDEFSEAICDEVGARLDNFVTQLHQNAGSSGLVLIYPKADNPQTALSFEDRINRGFFFRKYEDEYRPKIVYAKPANEIKVQFWLIPQGADEPEYTAARQGEMFEKVNKPFLYNTEFGGEECPAASPAFMAKMVALNPNIDLHIIVRGKSARYRNRKMNKWLSRLVTKEKIPRERIRVILSRNLEADYPYENVEFWMVPIKKH